MSLSSLTGRHAGSDCASGKVQTLLMVENDLGRNVRLWVGVAVPLWLSGEMTARASLPAAALLPSEISSGPEGKDNESAWRRPLLVLGLPGAFKDSGSGQPFQLLRTVTSAATPQESHQHDSYQ